MKKTLITALTTLLALTAFTQSPHKFKYQAFAHDGNGNPLASQSVSVRAGILQDNISGTLVYSEEHAVTTTETGLIILEIGGGSVVSGDFTAIDWAGHEHFLQIEMDENGGSNYQMLGASQLLSVPYALFANQANVADSASNAVWIKDGTTIYYNDGKVGIGNDIPEGKLVVMNDPSSDPNDAIFCVVNSTGDTVLAVYEQGVRIWVADDPSLKAPGNKSGFAVGGFSLSKTMTDEYFRVYPDSVRVYIKDSVVSAGGDDAGGFSVKSLSSPNGDKLLMVTRDSSRFWTDGAGGFQVRDLAGGSANYLNLTPENYFIGHAGGSDITNGLYNSTLGYYAGKYLTEGDQNIFIGYLSGLNTTTGSNNIFIGNEAGFANTEGVHNVFIGHNAGQMNSGVGSNTGDYNVFVGFQAGAWSDPVSSNDVIYNTFLGYKSGYHNETGSGNTYVGAEAGFNSLDGSSNVCVGNRSGFNNIDGFGNVFVGGYAGNYSTENWNTMVGYQCGMQMSKGSGNSFYGYQAGLRADSSVYNTYIGTSSGLWNETGTENTMLGYYAGFGNVPGANYSYNTCMGANSGVYLSTGGGNTFVGARTGYVNSSANDNTCVGSFAAYLNYTGGQNVFIGADAAYNAAGDENVIIGNGAGRNATGSRNVILGEEAGYNTTGSNNVLIGRRVGYTEAGSDRLMIDNSDADSTTALIYGQFDNDFVRINNSLAVGRNPATNQLEVEGYASKTTAGSWLANSDRRIKTDISEIDGAFETMLQLHPVKFRYTDEWRRLHPSAGDRYYYNFIAQEYRQVFPESVKGSGEFLPGDKDEILQIDTYNAQIVTIKAVQELILKNRQQEKTIEELKTEIGKINTVLQQSAKK